MSSEADLSTKTPHRESFRVRSFDVDTENRLCPTALTRFLLEAAWHHAKRLGYGYSALGEQQLFWVLSRIAVEIQEPPHWEDEVTIETWPAGTQRMFALRDYEMRTADGRPVAIGTSAWLVLDAETRRPVRIENVFDRGAFETGRRALDHSLEKLSTFDPVDRQPDYSKPVVYSDLDRHDHVNSVAYLQWIIDSYRWDALEHATLKRFELNYLAETAGGEHVELFSRPAPNAPDTPNAPAPSGVRQHLIRRGSDLRPICSAKLSWSSPAVAPPAPL